jgi:YD repeat-containing protein
LFEDLEYQYNWLDDELIQNRLYHVNDLIAGSPQEGDIEDQGTFYDAQNQIKTDNNYLYTAIGELQVDKSEDIEEIVWRVDSKIAEVRRTSQSQKKNLRFDYDAMGNRIAKHIYTDNAFTLLEKSTYYVRDASGNVMAVYDRIHRRIRRNRRVHAFRAAHLWQFTNRYGCVNARIRSRPVHCSHRNHPRARPQAV